MDGYSILYISLSLEDRVCIQTLVESELSKFKPLRKCGKEIPVFWRDRLFSVLKSVEPNKDNWNIDDFR